MVEILMLIKVMIKRVTLVVRNITTVQQQL